TCRAAMTLPPLSESIPNSMRRPGGICVFGNRLPPPKKRPGRGSLPSLLHLPALRGVIPAGPASPHTGPSCPGWRGCAPALPWCGSVL
ncbi:Helix-turn-helix domain-containing protein, partial [Dysosmobacter welbionis]